MFTAQVFRPAAEADDLIVILFNPWAVQVAILRTNSPYLPCSGHVGRNLSLVIHLPTVCNTSFADGPVFVGC